MKQERVGLGRRLKKKAVSAKVMTTPTLYFPHVEADEQYLLAPRSLILSSPSIPTIAQTSMYIHIPADAYATGTSPGAKAGNTFVDDFKRDEENYQEYAAQQLERTILELTRMARYGPSGF